LDEAAEAFAHGGYDATSVAQVCERAGVTKGAFYYHFPSKQALFLELLDDWLADLDAQFLKARTEAATVPEALRQMATMARQAFETSGEQLPIILEFWTQAARDPEIWKAASAPYHRYRAFFADLVRTGIEEGSVRPEDPEMVAEILVSLAVGLVLQGVMDPKGTNWGSVAEEGIRLFLRGLEPCDE
jgi:AcrR family transcriptional regulator